MRKAGILVFSALVLSAACGTDSDTAGPEATVTAEAQASACEGAAGTVVVYSGRKEELLRPVLDGFQQAKGGQVAVKAGKTAEMAAQILEERSAPKADVFIGQDAGSLQKLTAEGGLTAYDPPGVDAIPAEFRAPDGSWIGLSGRARVIMYNTNLVAAGQVPDSVFDLTDPKWKGKVGVASSQEGAVVGWVASLRKLKGDAETAKFLKALIANEIKVLPGHTEVRKAVGNGELHLGLVNHYYFHLSRAEGALVGVVYPDQGDGEVGILVNAAGSGVVKGGPNAQGAKCLQEYLVSPEAQKAFAEGNYEYPLRDGVPLREGVKPASAFKRSKVNLTDLGQDLDGTLKLMDASGLK